jgi:hypothetical protein
VETESDSREAQLSAPVVRKSLPHWILEGLFIVVSVLLGFGVAQLGEYRNNRDLAGRVLASIGSEVARNLATLEPLLPMHRAWSDALETVDTSNTAQSGLDLLFATRPRLPPNTLSPFPILRRSAWDAAVSSGALRLIDYGVAEALSEIYSAQEIATSNVDRLTMALSSTAMFDPAHRVASARLLWLTIEDIRTAEALLLELYRRHLPSIRAAAEAS